jgi:hypothetical protein
LSTEAKKGATEEKAEMKRLSPKVALKARMDRVMKITSPGPVNMWYLQNK